MAGHICRHAKDRATPEAFFEALRTKQYTDARLRRALLFGAIGVTESDLRAMPAYTTLLAANSRGRAYLKERRKTHREDGSFAVVTKPADTPEGRQRELGELGDSLFTLCFPSPRPAGDMMKRSTIMGVMPSLKFRFLKPISYITRPVYISPRRTLKKRPCLWP